VEYYNTVKQDTPTAIKFCQRAISLASETRNTKRHCQATIGLAWSEWYNGNWCAAQKHGCEAQRLAHISGDLFLEAAGLHFEGLCWDALGNYKTSVLLFGQARDLLALCGMSGRDLDHIIMASQAQIYRSKSEYTEAYNMHMQILQEAPMDHNPRAHAFHLLNLAETCLLIGASKDDVQQKIEKAKELFQATKQITQVTMCDTILAKLYLRERDIFKAKTLFETCLTLSSKHPQIKSFCLEHLANMRLWGVPNGITPWTTVFLVHSLKCKEKLGIYKALQFLGDVFLAQDEETAISLYKVALAGFTQMDVHCSRAECMLHLGDISQSHGDWPKAVEYWDRAKPLFEWSSQAKQVEQIDERLARAGKDVLEQHRKNLAHLKMLNAPNDIVKEGEDDLSHIEELEDGLNAVKLPE
jgi:tetratricopeptide (TPR) repeat protein